MRQELYNQYVEQHPEEMTGVNTAFAYSRHIEGRREKMRQSKVERVREWKKRLYGDSDE